MALWKWILIGYFAIGALLAVVAWWRSKRVIAARRSAASQAPRWGFESGDLKEAQGCLIVGLLLLWPITAPIFFKKRPDLESKIN